MVTISGESIMQAQAVNSPLARRTWHSFRVPVTLAIIAASLLHMMGPMLWSTKTTNNATRMASGSPHDRYWCMLTKPYKPNKWFSTTEHFPHTLEFFAECWTWLQEKSNFAGENVKGGFIMDSVVKRKLDVKYWNRAIVPALKFPLQIWSNDTNVQDVMDATFVFDKYHKNGKYYQGGWFQRSDTCKSFRQHLWNNLDVKPRKVSKKHRRIGIINRNESRAILSIDKLVRELRTHYKNVHVEVTTFDSEYVLTDPKDTLANQAAWFADKDMVIMAHGAAMSNVIFMRPGTAILELFPRYYFNDMFWDLMDQCQIYHSWYYDGNMTTRESPTYTQSMAQKETDKQWDYRMQHKKSNIQFLWKDVDHIIKLLFDAVDSKSNGKDWH